MQKIYSICYNPSIENATAVMKNLAKILGTYGVQYNIYDIDNINSVSDFAFIIGGDGSILKAARYYANTETPILGINLGHLGFLSQAAENELEDVVKRILDNNYNIQRRMMLESGDCIALNDFVIKGAEISRASGFSLEINGEFVCDYFADGLIISTPTGSTAYGMAAGGPILDPNSDVITIVPICPHTLNARPIVVNSNSEIKILTKPMQKYCVVADGQNVFKFCNEITVKKSSKYTQLALLNNNYYSVLRDKLHWGINPTKK